MNELHGVTNVDDNNQPPPIEQFSRYHRRNTCSIVRIIQSFWGVSKEDGRYNKPMGKINVGNVKPMRLQLFDIFFMKNYIQIVLISYMNKSTKGNKITYGEILVWISLWLVTVTIEGFQHQLF